MRNQRILIVFIFLSLLSRVEAQQLFQNIKGTVLDADSHQPLPGVNVYILDSNPTLGTITSPEGDFLLNNVPIGRHNIQFSFLGYEAAIIREVVVGSAKEVVLNIKLKEQFNALNEIVVKPEERKDKPQNSMATLSARSFSVEEAMRYAGGWNDPARLASSFAGVSMAEGVNDNAIVIRGNAPKGILWRLEGVEIPAPNHLNGVNNGGGIETVFSVNMLANSDFFTGAFPAEYGNAMSGAFDMRFRTGNNQKRESTFQVGSQGIDISSEGPLKKGSEASYLFNYRYSTMGLIGNIMDGNFGLPAYQDLSFKVHLPTSQAGEFSLWGIGGLSSVAFDPDSDPMEWKNTFDNNKYDTGSDIAATGMNHKINIGSKSYVNTSLALTYDRFTMVSDQINADQSSVALANHYEDNTKLIISSYINHKFNNKHSNRTGINYTTQWYDIDVQGNPNPEEQPGLIEITDQNGTAEYMQLYSQSKFRIKPTWDVNVGIHASYYGVNNELVFEPRLGSTWRFIPMHSFSLAYGKHSKLEPLRFYEASGSNGDLLNPDLAVTKAHHFVFSYDYRINSNLKLKVEPYYQHLYDVPVVEGSTISLINYEWDMYFSDPLNNSGTGSNVGVDITLERYMKEGLYYMLTGSIFDSKYIGGDRVEYNTSFNRNFVFNLLGGKEWAVKGNNTIGLNGKLTYMGGNRFTPPDQEASHQAQMVVLDESKAFEWQEENKLFLDIGINYRINKSKVAHVITIQAKNVLMQSEMFGWAYDFEQQKVVEHGLTMMYPYLTYRLEF
ncbi:TonB-dependent receptor [Saccharicrinis aurantiacus]|uniref:TonB-dependent receptor n=1 Tax=Saccharicrinis aurantiacus TaxID=1849719 RepID=UPI0008387E74|nr:TonB-dependent receptor [Saccharicrinis aurantiacus]